MALGKTSTLIPAQVPWMISASTPYLRLSCSESSSDSPTHVRFVGYFGLEEREDVEKEDRRNVTTYYPPYDSNVVLGPKTGRDQLVRITFSHSIAARMLGSHSD